MRASGFSCAVLKEPSDGTGRSTVARPQGAVVVAAIALMRSRLVLVFASSPGTFRRATALVLHNARALPYKRLAAAPLLGALSFSLAEACSPPHWQARVGILRCEFARARDASRSAHSTSTDHAPAPLPLPPPLPQRPR